MRYVTQRRLETIEQVEFVRRRLSDKMLTPRWLKELFPHATAIEFCGEFFLFDKENRRLFAHIREPYYMAWRDFSWSIKCPGIGLNRPVLEFAKRNQTSIFIFVRDVQDRAYRADPEDWLINGDQDAVDGVEVLVLPWHERYFQTVVLDNLIERGVSDE